MHADDGEEEQPSAPAARVDEPAEKRDEQQAPARSGEHVRTRPDILDDREPAPLDVPQYQTGHTRERQAARLALRRLSGTRPMAGHQPEQLGRDRGELRKNAFVVAKLVRAERQGEQLPVYEPCKIPFRTNYARAKSGAGISASMAQ